VDMVGMYGTHQSETLGRDHRVGMTPPAASNVGGEGCGGGARGQCGRCEAAAVYCG
jgi:hypothetical protein